MNNELILLTGADIPFVQGSVTIHQPTLYEISLIGETDFFSGCEMLRFSKKILKVKDNFDLNNYHDFDILMSIMNDYSGPMKYNVSCAKLVLDLLFPLYIVVITPRAISFLDRETNQTQGEINLANFDAFKDIITEMLCLTSASSDQDYKTDGELANKIAAKLERRHQKLAELNAQKAKTVAILSRYISILAVGEHKDMNALSKYTVYQLFNEFQRYQLKLDHDQVFQARLAGATGLKDPEDWKKNLHDQDQK